MRRHELDLVSLVAGLLFIVVAGVHVGARASDHDLDLQWTLPVLLLLVGVLGLLGALRGQRGTPSVDVDVSAGPTGAEPDNSTAEE